MPASQPRDLFSASVCVLEGADAENSIMTNAKMAVDQVFKGNLTFSDSDFIRIDLAADIGYNFSTWGTSGASGVRDTQVRLLDSSGASVGFNNDTEPGNSNSFLEFRPAQAGTYYVEVNSYDGGPGDYNLLVADDTYTAEQVASFLADFAWGRSAPLRLDDDNGTLTYNVINLTESGQVLARYALEAWGDVSGLQFVETSASNASLRFDDDEAGAFAGPRSIGSDGGFGYSEINISTDWVARHGTTLDSYSFQTYLHEIGHALGLGHAGSYNGAATYGTDNAYDNDSWQLTIMSYFSQRENTNLDASFGWAVSPMVADILAIQYIYGYAPTAAAGDTVHGVNTNVGGYQKLTMDAFLGDGTSNLVDGDGHVAITLIDSGGEDTLSFIGLSGTNRIDLRAGAVSDVFGRVGNLIISYDAAIENYIGGTGRDVVTGNSADNILSGSSGDDVLAGGNGHDTLDGGQGRDVMSGGLGRDQYIVDHSGDIVTELVDSGWDTVTTYVSYQNTENVEVVILGGSGDIDGTGTNGNDILVGNVGQNELRGGDGDDRLDGRKGGDIAIGGKGRDTYVVNVTSDVVIEQAGEGWDTIVAWNDYRNVANVEVLILAGEQNIKAIGTSQNDTLIGNSGSNELRGWDGDDRLDGRQGADVAIGGKGRDNYVVNVASDVVIEQAGEGWDTIVAWTSFQNVANVEVVTLAGSGDTNAWGTSDNDILVGNTGRNELRGGDGDDKLDGRKGADLAIGGKGDDTYVVNVSSDQLIEQVGEGSDIILAWSSYQIAENVETLILAGRSDINATGSSSNDVLVGNSGRNYLDGRAGDDTLTGGTGADFFLFRYGTDTVTDFSLADGDILLLDESLLAGNSLQSYGALIAGDAVFNFGAGAILIVENQTSLDLDNSLIA